MSQEISKDLVRKARLEGMIVPGKRYHSTLPPELEPYYCYVKDGGHCILIVLPGRDGPPEDWLVPASVKSVLKRGYTIRDGYVFCDLPCSKTYGLVQEADTEEFDLGDQACGTMSFIHIENDGQMITDTNYWDSDYARNGIWYFSVNAGCVRCLLPPGVWSSFEKSVVKTTDYVVISRGVYRGQDGYEILFEDHSSSPYVVETGANQWERAIPTFESGRTGIAFHIYDNGLLVGKLHAKFRAVAILPFLRPWKCQAREEVIGRKPSDRADAPHDDDTLKVPEGFPNVAEWAAAIRGSQMRYCMATIAWRFRGEDYVYAPNTATSNSVPQAMLATTVIERFKNAFDSFPDVVSTIVWKPTSDDRSVWKLAAGAFCKAHSIRFGHDKAFTMVDGIPYFLVAIQDEFTPEELAQFEHW